DARSRRGARAGGPLAPGHGGGLPGLRDGDPGLSGRAAVLPPLPAGRPGGRQALRQTHGAVRRAAARARAAFVEFLRRQSAEAGAGARDVARAQGAAGRPADARRRHRRHRVHPSRAGEEPRPGLRRAGRVSRAGRDPVARRSDPGHVCRPHHGGGAGRPRRRTHARPHDGRSAACAERGRGGSPPRRPLPGWAEIALVPLINIALAFVTVGIIVRIIGVDPLHALRLLVVGAIGSSESIGYTLYYATNFIFTGLAVAVAFHAGLFNIG